MRSVQTSDSFAQFDSCAARLILWRVPPSELIDSLKSHPSLTVEGELLRPVGDILEALTREPILELAGLNGAHSKRLALYACAEPKSYVMWSAVGELATATLLASGDEGRVLAEMAGPPRATDNLRDTDAGTVQSAWTITGRNGEQLGVVRLASGSWLADGGQDLMTLIRHSMEENS